VSNLESTSVTGMAGLSYPITQVSLVVRDLHETMDAYHRAFGWSGWKVFDYVAPFQHDADMRGLAVEYTLRAAEVMVGSMSFVLLQPLTGVSLWKEFIESRGEGIASISLMFDTPADAQTARQEFLKIGIDVTTRALVGNHSEYFYLDTQERFGCLIESGSADPLDFAEPVEVYPAVVTDAQASSARTNEITQIAVVVRDLEAKLKEYHEAFGWAPWKVFQSDGETIMHSCTLDGEPSEFFNIRWAEVQVGHVIFELVQPLGGDNPWQRMLDDHGEGIGSIAVMFKTELESEAVKREFLDAGWGVTSSGRIGDHIEWYYLDTEPAFKCVIESGSGHAIEFMEPDSFYPDPQSVEAGEAKRP
jgi:methylmalonyl-CoA/ethylmalonyl-CoA epimerase